MLPQLGPKTSDIIVAIYLAITLVVRFLIEPQIQNYPIISIAFGLFALLFIWAVSKTRFLNPNWFGLLKTKQVEQA